MAEFLGRQLSQVRTFLDRIGLEVEDTICLVVLKKAKAETEKDTRIQRFVQVGEIEKYLAWLRYENARDGNIYLTPCKMIAQATHRTKENFRANQRVFWLDLDSKKIGASLLVQQVLTLLPIPTCLVRSSRSNYQAYFVLETEYEFRRLAGIMEYLNRVFQLDPTQDISRILRLPGFWNRKLGKDGKVKDDMCYLVERKKIVDKRVTITGRRLSHAELEAIENKLCLSQSSSGSLVKIEPKVKGEGERVELSIPKRNCLPLSKEKESPQAETELAKLYEWFVAKVGPKYKSQSEADMAFTCSAIRRGSKEEEVKSVLQKYVDSTKHKVEDYISRTYEKAIFYLGK